MAISGYLQSLARGLSILQMVAKTEGGMQLKDIASALGIAPSTAHSLVKTLSARGFLEQKGSSKYQLGSMLQKTAEQHASRLFRGAAVKIMQKIHAQVPSAILVLGEPIGYELRTTLRISPDQPGEIQEQTNQPLHIYATASGLAYLAFCAEEERLILRQIFPFWEHGSKMWKSPEELDTFLKDVRRKKYAALSCEKDIFVAASPVFGKNRVFKASFGLCMPNNDPKKDEAVQLILQGARELSEQRERAV